MKLLFTGAGGMVGTMIRPLLLERSDIHLVLADLHLVEPVHEREEAIAFDLQNFDAVADAVRGVDGIIHFGGQSLEADFDILLGSNIRGTYNVFEAARRNGKPRILFGSSNHVVGYYSVNETLNDQVQMRPDTLYGVTKGFGELLSRLYWDKFKQECVCVRIGSCFPEPSGVRMLSTWLSARDMARLVFKVFDSPKVDHMMLYAASDNTRSWYNNDHASALGWVPVDSVDRFSEKIMRDAEGVRPVPTDALQGGKFAAEPHPSDR